ncbi:MAG: hypothetical protein AAGJ18_09265 [Bacteroidota bacterium]
MKNKTDHLEDFFQSAFNDAEQLEQPAAWNEPSDAVWGNIQEGLREERRFSLVALRWPWSAIAASYLLLMSGYQFFQNKSENVAIEEVVIVEKMVSNTSDDCERVLRTDDFSRRGNTVNNLVQRRLKSSVREAQELSPKIDKLFLEGFENQVIAIGSYPSVLQSETNELSNITSMKKGHLESENTTVFVPEFTLPIAKKTKNYVAVSYAPVAGRLSDNSSKGDQNQSRQGHSLDVNIGKTNEKGWTLETGLQYTKMEESLVQVAENNQRLIPTTTHLDVPVTVKKSWTKKRTRLAVKTGLVNRFELNQMAATNRENVEEISKISTKKYIPMVTAGVELAYAVSPKLSVYVAPTVAKSLTPVIDVEGMELAAEQLMVQVGVRYEL